MSTISTITAEQLIDMPNDGMRHELIRGELTTMAPSGAEHGGTVGMLSLRLFQHVEDHKLGIFFGAETGFLLARQPDTVLAPDAAFVRHERIPAAGLPRHGYFPGPPDLAVEVISPHDRLIDVDEKVHDWLAHGAMEVWVVNPRSRTVTLYHSPTDIRLFAANDTLVSPELLPGFSLLVGTIFR